MSLLDRFRKGGSRTSAPAPAVPAPAQTPLAAPAAAQNASSGGVPIWMLGVVLIAVLIIAACAGFLLLSEPVPQEVVVQPTAILKPGQTAVVSTPVPGVVSSSEEEGGILPVGGILLFAFIIVVIAAVVFAIYWSIYHPLLIVPVDQQYYITDQRKGTVRVQKAGWTIIRKPIEIIAGPFSVGIISLEIPQKIVLMKPAGAEAKNIEGELRIRMDLMVQYSIGRLEVLAKKVEGKTPQAKITNLQNALEKIIVSLMEITSHRFEVGQWEELALAFSNKAARPFSEYGIDVIGIRIINRDYADSRVQDAQDSAAIQVANAVAEKSAAKMDGAAIRQFLRAAGVKGPITADNVALIKQVLGGKGLLEGLLTANLPAILQMLTPKPALASIPTFPRLATVAPSSVGVPLAEEEPVIEDKDEDELKEDDLKEDDEEEDDENDEDDEEDKE